MENVTCIYNKCVELCNNNEVRKQRLQKVSDLLEKEAGVVLAFCEIIGSRWKFLCGSEYFITPFFKYPKGDGYGVMVQEWGELEDEKDDVIKFLFDKCL